jgi:putative RNA 2'-phosphotransferase
MDRQLVKISKFLSLAFRHQPGRIGLTLDAQGWADVDELLSKANQHGVALTRPLLDEVVEQNDKQRFAFSAGGARHAFGIG